MGHRVARCSSALLVLCLLCGTAGVVDEARAATTITVGDHRLFPNQPGQVIDVRVTGGDAISGIDFYAQVGDGGPELAAFGVPAGTVGPHISSIDLLEGTIFDGVSDQPVDLSSPLLPQTALQTLALIGNPNSVLADGVLARLTVDTTGLFEGTWVLRLSDVLPYSVFGGPHTTNFAGRPVNQIKNGKITVDFSLCDTNGDGRCDPLGDVDANGRLDDRDIDSLSVAVQAGATHRAWDINFDGKVDTSDRDHWVKDLRLTYYGDANLDGVFTSKDFVFVFLAAEYEDAIDGNSTWATGDWDGDRDFRSSDFVVAFLDGGYEQGPRVAAASVPEPTGWLWVTGWIAALLVTWRRHSLRFN